MRLQSYVTVQGKHSLYEVPFDSGVEWSQELGSTSHLIYYSLLLPNKSMQRLSTSSENIVKSLDLCWTVRRWTCKLHTLSKTKSTLLCFPAHSAHSAQSMPLSSQRSADDLLRD